MDKSKKHIKINQKGGNANGNILNPFNWKAKALFSKNYVDTNMTEFNTADDFAKVDDAGKKEIANFDPDSIYNHAKFWDDLWEEPCWVIPGEDFSLSNLGDLWTKWYNPDVKKAIFKMVPVNGGFKIDKIKCKKFYKDAIKQTGFQKDWAELMETNNSTAEPNQGITGKATEICGADAIINDDIVEEPYEGGSKWVFCLIIKCLLGPAGFFILKMMPHIVRFVYTVGGIYKRLSYHATQRTLPYINSKGEHKRSHLAFGGKPAALMRVILSYLGTVIPFHFFSHRAGTQYGRGEFGKLIVGLTAVSAGIILMGGLGISVILICFLFYCAKVIGMFSDNVTETKKK